MDEQTGNVDSILENTVLEFEEVPDIPANYMELGAHKRSARVSLILGIITMILGLIPFTTLLALPTGCIALATGHVGVEDEITKTKSVLGITFGAVGILAMIIWVVLTFVLEASVGGLVLWMAYAFRGC